MLTLQPVRFPRPVPIPRWIDDYADIPERIARDGRLDLEEVWLPQSGDGWQSFCRRHGTYGFDFDWMEFARHERTIIANGKERLARQAAEQQEKWEAERRARQQAKQAEADREWAEAEAAKRKEREAKQALERQTIEAAKAGWSAINPDYANQAYHRININKSGELYGVWFEAGHTYLVPTAVMFAITGHNL